MTKSFAELEFEGLQWKTVGGGWNPEYALVTDDGETIATLKNSGSWWREQAFIDAVGNHWVFERRGFLKRYIEISSVGTGDILARFDYRWDDSGELSFPEGRGYRWRQSNFWGSKWVWIDESGEPIMGFKSGGFFRYRADISVDADALADKAPPLLIFLGWYLILLWHKDSAAAAIAAT
jgi:hypothetical protein